MVVRVLTSMASNWWFQTESCSMVSEVRTSTMWVSAQVSSLSSYSIPPSDE